MPADMDGCRRPRGEAAWVAAVWALDVWHCLPVRHPCDHLAALASAGDATAPADV
ncbi:hypothetical protein RISK_002071 [Rhodopirellula islandica]|uniref:Uncharacterized protein n=1 Tax=Rhodopirellula islandica TaxID=595434 RepID=A0A0J1EIW7_RHOIS|nr:hypothetical protein RISK_002071 [Rhodopirellula islandica]